MQRTNYNFPTSIRFGEGVIDELSDYLTSNGLKKPLIVTDPMLETLEVFKNAIAPLKSNVVFPPFIKTLLKKMSLMVFSLTHLIIVTRSSVLAVVLPWMRPEQ